MLKKSVIRLVLFAVLALMSLQVKAQQPLPQETELTDYIMRADAGLNLNEPETAEYYLLQAKNIIVAYPGINPNLQGHFNKVSGKFYMKSSLSQALEYFNLAAVQFGQNQDELAQITLFTGIAYFYDNNFVTAKLYFNQAKEYFIVKNDYANLAQVLNNLGVIAYEQGDQEAAVEFCQQALLINIEITNSLNATRNQVNLEHFTGSSSFTIKNKSDFIRSILPNNELEGGGGSSGSGTTINTGGSGTVVVGGIIQVNFTVNR